MKTVDICRLLGEETRYRIINVLLERPTCVCELQDVLQINQVSASKHLAKMRQAGMVMTQKEGQRVYYSLSPSILRHETLTQLIYNSRLEEPFAQDIQRLTTNLQTDPIYVCPTEKRS